MTISLEIQESGCLLRHVNGVHVSMSEKIHEQAGEGKFAVNPPPSWSAVPSPGEAPGQWQQKPFLRPCLFGR